ncbi:MAG: DUF853 family protein [bacterium]|nr:DUF853 family protein [bacterium]
MTTNKELVSECLTIGARVDASGLTSTVGLVPRMANRHGLVAGATGTGKTVTLQVLAEQFSRAGVPVFAADVKGDLTGLMSAGTESTEAKRRLLMLSQETRGYSASPTVVWDVAGKNGVPLRTTISEFGPDLLSALFELNDTQDSVLRLAFAAADSEGLLLLDLKDLDSLLRWIQENREEVSLKFGNIASSSLMAIQRRVSVLAQEGGDTFFGEPALNISDFLSCDFSGQGVINLLYARELLQTPKVYCMFLLWFMSELFENLDEVGDADKPRLVFFFDEAHLLFKDTPKALVNKIEQVVRLIRSRGVGIYFVTQSPDDIPETILSQLGNRFLHALRTFTPAQKKSLRAAADGFAENPHFKAEDVIPNLGLGEALVSTLDEKGSPRPVEIVTIAPPFSRIGPSDKTLVDERVRTSPFFAKYATAIDRQSAFEVLKKRSEERQNTIAEKEAKEQEERRRQKEEKAQSRNSRSAGGSNRQSAGEAFFKSMLRSVGTTLGRQIIRGVLGSIVGRR